MAFLDHTLSIFTNPSEEWRRIREQDESFRGVFLTHTPFLALIPVISAFYGVTQVGWTIGGGDADRLTVESALSLCALTYVALLAGIFIFGEFINWMSPTFNVEGPEDRVHYNGTALAVFVTTPLLLSGIFLAYPVLWLNALAMVLAGCYSLYLIYEGIPILMNIDKGRSFVYATSVVTVGLVLMVTAMIGTVLIWEMGLEPVYID